jgi:NADP-dependent 3-hydroxy acid dehydrogenase YdfG
MNKTTVKPVIMITGASSGIGAGLAKLFSSKGYQLALCSRNTEAMNALNLPNALCLQVDVTDAAAIQNAVTQAQEYLGPIDCLINNAGFGKNGDFTELTHTEHAAMVQVNLMGVINSIEAVLPKMREQQHGTIINISSLADRHPRPNLAVYAASKAAVKSLSESLRLANAKFGVRVCHVAPAKINTPMLIQSTLNDDHLISIDEIAKTILWIYEQPQHICIRDIVIAPTYYES